MPRPQLSKSRRYRVLCLNDFKCIYCECALDIKGSEMDHFVPYHITKSSANGELVPSCPVCNAIKGAREFLSITDAQQYVNEQRKLKGLPYLSKFIASESVVTVTDLPSASNVKPQAESPCDVAERRLAAKYEKGSSA